MRNFPNSQENICARITFLITLNSVGLQFIKKETLTLAQVFPYEFCKICKNIFFSEHHWTTASDYSISIVVKGELANEIVNYDTKTKA